MSKQGLSKKVEQAKQVARLPLPKILEGQTFLIWQSGKHDVKQMLPRTFDCWVDALCEEITGVNREIWDVFARQRFINFLLAEGILNMQTEANGTILLIETEEKTSALEGQTEDFTSDTPQGERYEP